MMLRSVASEGGGPGNRWTYFQDSSRHWNARASPNSSTMEAPSSRTHIYEWNHLSYGGAGPLSDIYDIDDEADRYDWYGPVDHEYQNTPVPVQCGCQDRCALRGTHRGTRSSYAPERRFTNWKAKQTCSRRDFRAWKSHFRPHVKNFLAHSPRICELTVCTNPHPITIFSIYAPSQVEDANEDQSRKESFWSQLDNLITEHANSSRILLLGALNARLDEQLDPEQDFIGPNVWGKRQSIDDPLRDNAVCLLDFLQAHLLILSQTFSSLPSDKLVTYKEMTTTTHLLENFEVTDWTALDYAACTHPAHVDLTFKGSIFQQLINTWHLPLYFTYRTSFSPLTKTSTAPKLDYSLFLNFRIYLNPNYSI